MKKSALLLIVLSLTLRLGADNGIDPCADYTWQEGDDIVVEVTVGELRIANCYYEQYFIERDLAIDYKADFDESVVINKDMLVTVAHLENENKALRILTIGTTTLAGIGFIVAFIAGAR